MNIKKNLLSRISRRKGSQPPEAEEESNELPPPTAIEPGVPYSTEDTRDKSYGSHLELELLATGEPPQPDPVSGAGAQENAPAPALESLAEPIAYEPPSEPESPHEVELHQEYGLEMEVLAASESDESPAAPEPPQEDEEAVAAVAESAVEESAPEAEIAQDSEPEAVGDLAPEGEEPLAASASSELSDEAEMSHEPEPLEGYGEDFEALAVPEADESSGEAEPPPGDEEAVAAVAESAAEESQSELEMPQDSESEAVEVAVDPPREEPDESPKTPIAENGFFPLVRDSRGNWRSGKGFSRSELREAGLSPAEAARLQIRVDKRRRNTHPVNVAALEKAKSGV
ncbi:MAG: ribosomal protein L13e [Rhodospirillaceae bacterium]|nr:ribosomal protein L13e [Rhodospirillaceae bacterium]